VKTTTRTRNAGIALPSLGLTVDTPLGPVDLVAVERVRSGVYVRLTRAEEAWLNEHLDYNYQRAELVAEALGITRDSVLRRIDRARNKQPKTAAAVAS
jgi:hypothetical protein